MYLKKIFSFIITSIITLLCFEFYFQTSEISLPSTVQDDSTFGRSFKPHARINLIKESFYMGEVNELGYLGPAYPVEKPSNTIRIALIGDSFVEGFQVADKYHFRNILENELKRKIRNQNIEVLNFGRSGLDFRKMYIYYELRAKEYKPDIVLIFLTESSFRTRDNNLGPDLIFDKNKKLEIDFRFANSQEFKTKINNTEVRNFSIFSLFQAVYANLSAGKTPVILFDKLFTFYSTNTEEETFTRADFESDEFAELNELVLKEYSIENSQKKIVIVPIEKISKKYNELISKYKIDIYSLDSIYNELNNNGINPFYWNATNKLGHWNQIAHNYIGNYLASSISELIAKKSHSIK